MIDLRLGRYQDVLADVECDAVITDPPYSDRTHKGHNAVVGIGDGNIENEINYQHWTADDVKEFVGSWLPRCRGWFCAMTSHDLFPAYEEALQSADRVVFQPIPCIMRGASFRLHGDGPSGWSVWMVVARPRTREFAKWGTLDGAYIGTPERNGVVGGKPLWLMSAIIRDYSRPGDLICDPCAGGATTLIAAASQGRRAVGAEMDPETYRKAMQRIQAGYTPDMLETA